MDKHVVIHKTKTIQASWPGVMGGPRHGIGNSHQKFSEVWMCGAKSMLCDVIGCHGYDKHCQRTMLIVTRLAPKLHSC